MIAVQSLWLGAETHATHRQVEDCWLLSGHYARESFGRVELWADEAGEAWLREIGARYDAWHRLPEIEDELRGVWSVGKLLAASMQTGPFLHVDGDVFWRCAPPLEVPFLVEHAEIDKPAGAWWDRVGFAPMERPAQPTSYNFGVFGGASWREIGAACRAVVDCLRAHRALVAGCQCGCLPMLAEQVWVPSLLRLRRMEPTCHLRHDRLQEDAAWHNYFHAMSGKRDPQMLERIHARRVEVLGPRC